jgi:hypothetical protein
VSVAKQMQQVSGHKRARRPTVGFPSARAARLNVQRFRCRDSGPVAPPCVERGCLALTGARTCLSADRPSPSVLCGSWLRPIRCGAGCGIGLATCDLRRPEMTARPFPILGLALLERGCGEWCAASENPCRERCVGGVHSGRGTGETPVTWGKWAMFAVTGWGDVGLVAVGSGSSARRSAGLGCATLRRPGGVEDPMRVLSGIPRVRGRCPAERHSEQYPGLPGCFPWP